jgi:hypothetical protein
VTSCKPAAHVVAGGFNQIITLPAPTQNDIDVTEIGGGVVTFVAACDGATKYSARQAKAAIKTTNCFLMPRTVEVHDRFFCRVVP